MRIVALEEHFAIADLLAEIPAEAMMRRGYPPPDNRIGPTSATNRRLLETGASRLANMDASGITMQVLSWAGAGADLLAPDIGPTWSRRVNDGLSEIVKAHPDRFAGFAHLPVTSPAAAADELSRCVDDLGFVGAMINGTTDGKFLDDPEFAPILSRAEALNVPIYLHPNLPPPVVAEAYYSGLPSGLGRSLATNCFGWHAETAVHVLRLIFSGSLERHRALKLIVGHMGETLPMMLARATAMSEHETNKSMSRNVAQQLQDQVYVTTSGQFTLPPLFALIDTFGIDHVMFSVDYPYAESADGRQFIDTLPLAPGDVTRIASGNADRLLQLRRT